MRRIAVLPFFLAATLHAQPVRIAHEDFSMILPDGWQQMNNEQATRMRAESKPQTETMKRFEDQHTANDAILVMKHDTSGQLAASVQVFYKPVIKQLEGLSALGVARLLARIATEAAKGTLDGEPRETLVSGLPAVTWSIHYDLILPDGSTQPMFMRGFIVIIDKGPSDLGAKYLGTPREMMYTIGYSGPADDTTDAEAFDAVVKSIAIKR